MPPDMDDANLELVRAEILGEAMGVVTGTSDLLAAARNLLRLLGQLGLSWEDPDYHVIALIESETDHLPVGDERLIWHPEGLLRKEAELVRARAWAEEVGGVEACRNLASRFAPV